MTLYGIYVYYGGWNRLYQYPATQFEDEAQRLLLRAKANNPSGRYSIREINQ